MIRRVSEGVDLKLGKQILGQLLKQPVDDGTALNAALGVQDENDLGVILVVQRLLHLHVAAANVLCGVAECALDYTL